MAQGNMFYDYAHKKIIMEEGTTEAYYTEHIGKMVNGRKENII